MKEPGTTLVSQLKDFLFRDLFYFVSGLFILIASSRFVCEGLLTARLDSASRLGLIPVVYVVGFFVCYVIGLALNELLIILRIIRTKYHKPTRFVRWISSAYMALSDDQMNRMAPTAGLESSRVWRHSGDQVASKYQERMERIVNLMHIGQTMFGSLLACTLLLGSRVIFYHEVRLLSILIVSLFISMTMFFVQLIKNSQLSAIYWLIYEEDKELER